MNAYQILISEIERSIRPTIENGRKTYPDDKIIPLFKSIHKNWVEGGTGTPEEIAVLEEFLPKQLTNEQLAAIIKNTPASSLGDLMKFLKENHAGQYDGKTAKELYEARSV